MWQDDDTFDSTDATQYDLESDAPLRRDPYLQALNRELAPDLVEKARVALSCCRVVRSHQDLTQTAARARCVQYFDKKTNSVRVRRRFTVVETHTMLSWKVQRVVVPSSSKYHRGPGGIDPDLQPTYPLSAVLKSADAAINAAGPKCVPLHLIDCFPTLCFMRCVCVVSRVVRLRRPIIEDQRTVATPFRNNAFSGFLRG